MTFGLFSITSISVFVLGILITLFSAIFYSKKKQVLSCTICGIIFMIVGCLSILEVGKQYGAMKVIRNNYSLEINKTVVDNKVIKSDTTVVFK